MSAGRGDSLDQTTNANIANLLAALEKLDVTGKVQLKGFKTGITQFLKSWQTDHQDDFHQKYGACCVLLGQLCYAVLQLNANAMSSRPEFNRQIILANQLKSYLGERKDDNDLNNRIESVLTTLEALHEGLREIGKKSKFEEIENPALKGPSVVEAAPPTRSTVKITRVVSATPISSDLQERANNMSRELSNAKSRLQEFNDPIHDELIMKIGRAEIQLNANRRTPQRNTKLNASLRTLVDEADKLVKRSREISASINSTPASVAPVASATPVVSSATSSNAHVGSTNTMLSSFTQQQHSTSAQPINRGFAIERSRIQARDSIELPYDEMPAPKNKQRKPKAKVEGVSSEPSATQKGSTTSRAEFVDPVHDKKLEQLVKAVRELEADYKKLGRSTHSRDIRDLQDKIQVIYEYPSITPKIKYEQALHAIQGAFAKEQDKYQKPSMFKKKGKTGNEFIERINSKQGEYHYPRLLGIILQVANKGDKAALAQHSQIADIKMSDDKTGVYNKKISMLLDDSQKKEFNDFSARIQKLDKQLSNTQIFRFYTGQDVLDDKLVAKLWPELQRYGLSSQAISRLITTEKTAITLVIPGYVELSKLKNAEKAVVALGEATGAISKKDADKRYKEIDTFFTASAVNERVNGIKNIITTIQEMPKQAELKTAPSFRRS